MVMTSPLSPCCSGDQSTTRPAAAAAAAQAITASKAATVRTRGQDTMGAWQEGGVTLIVVMGGGGVGYVCLFVLTPPIQANEAQANAPRSTSTWQP